MLQPLAEIGAICEANDVLFYCDATASIGGNPLDKFVKTVRTRHHVEAGIRDAHHEAARGPKIRSNYFDLPMIMDYWGEERLNHHTEAASMLYCAHRSGQYALLRP